MEKTKTTWEELCERGRIARREYDKWRWVIGDLALEVVKEYGQDRLGEFAGEIGLAKQTVYRYRDLCEFYEKSPRGELFELYDEDVLTYTHYREAARLDDLSSAIDILETAADEAWTTDKMAYEVSKLLGKTGSERVYLAKEAPGMIHQSAGGVVTLRVVMSGSFILGDTVRVSVWRES